MGLIRGCHWCNQAQSQKSHIPKVAMETTTLPIAALSLLNVPVARDENIAPLPSAPRTRNPIDPVKIGVGKPMVLRCFTALRLCYWLSNSSCERIDSSRQRWNHPDFDQKFGEVLSDGGSTKYFQASRPIVIDNGRTRWYADAPGDHWSHGCRGEFERKLCSVHLIWLSWGTTMWGRVYIKFSTTETKRANQYAEASKGGVKKAVQEATETKPDHEANVVARLLNK